MAKILTVTVEHCSECRYLSSRKSCIKRVTMVVDNIPADPYGDIPKWCPLPDVEKC